MKYSDKLKHPKWQKKRLEILQRDNFTCQNCFDKESELHVHHIKYTYGSEIWDYENKLLMTLCISCHEDITSLKKDIKHRIDVDFVDNDCLNELSMIIELIENFNPYDLRIVGKLIEKYSNKRFKKLMKNG